MDFREDAATAALRAEVRAVLAAHLTPAVRERVERTGTHHDWPLHRAMAAKGWFASREPSVLSSLFRELELAGAPYDGAANTMMLSFILEHVGTERQRSEVLGALLAGDAVPALGYSEPESGSDVAAAATTAVRDGEHWVVTGQKMFTSLAEEATWVFMLTRTNTEVAKHRGLTFFLVPLDDPNVEIRPVRTLSGKRTNITFYDGVRVHDDWRVGDVDGGWQVMLVALAFERGVAGGVSDIAALYDAARAELRGNDDPSVRARLARVAIDKEVADLLGARAAWAAASGIPKQEGAEAKLFGTESYGRAAASLLDALGPDGLRRGGVLEHAYRYAPILTTAGGTSEIQKNLIAERTLGLPRAAR